MKDEDFHHLNSHDQNFKNLAVDYPIQAIEFFAHSVYPKIEGNPKVTFLRQEQQKVAYRNTIVSWISLYCWNGKLKMNRVQKMQIARHK